MKSADQIIDLGTEGGNGGAGVARGTAEEVAQLGESYTGKYLREVVGGRANGCSWLRLSAWVQDVR